ncbi:hypothetical protein [Tetragenococcus halophilus]|uniref:Uncharacterized protein n=1 Tax=Tetragenococcus halophilus TaxID=51669 RepID=A0AB35HM42_TETHA|nr:hypothetical protein [Tetragenococcus halophilus]MCO8288281.1 hypothetical protein [Tetragenococcus halophilus]MCO8290232.1 hypothetical protein [Tetragenococcus halophilus]MCO8294663.1 hypothetical protein [Tetragenococcus halophilus]MCO8297324.1 hypothetical protein [Tetragenococcus halophilus]
MAENEVIEQNNNAMNMVMGANLEQVTKQLQAISNFQSVVQSNLKKDQDFGVIPGTQKPTLLKPGAEKIQMLFGVTSEYEEIERIQDYDKGFFAYTIRCTLSQNGTKITEGMGHCNTKEKKYIKQDPFTLANTCLKMAKKRAQIDATLTIASLSEVFTQDIEDLKDFAQQEQMETMNGNDAGNMKVTFGKHKGKTLAQIMKEEDGESYVKWLSDKAREEPMRKAASMVLNGGGTKNDSKPKKTEKDENLVTRYQLEEINKRANVIADANNMNVDDVIGAYKIKDIESIDKKTASDLIDRLNDKVDKLQKKDDQTQQEALFDRDKPPFADAKPVTISDDDLPF